MTKNYRNSSKAFKTPRRPFEKERIHGELRLVGEYGLKNKREVWRVSTILSKIRSVARSLLTLDAHDPKRVFEGAALLRRLTRIGVLNEDEQGLDYVLGLTIEKFLDRRLQTRVQRTAKATSVHHARVIIRHKHIRLGKQICNMPGLVVRLQSEGFIDFAEDCAIAGGNPGRRLRKNQRNQ